MALLFNADTENVSIAAGATIDNIANITLVSVFRPTALDGTLHHFIHKGNELYIREGLTSAGRVQFFRVYATQSMSAVTTASALTVNEWHIAFGVDNGATNVPNLYIAQLGAALVQPSLSTQNDGQGALSDDSGTNLFWGHNSNTTNRSFVGDIAVSMFIAESLTLAQCKMVYGHITHGMAFDTRVYNILGYSGGAGVTQPDYSGNGNTGTVTGATVSDHAPLGPPFGFDVGFPFVTAAVGGLSIPVGMNQYFRQHSQPWM